MGQCHVIQTYLVDQNNVELEIVNLFQNLKDVKKDQESVIFVRKPSRMTVIRVCQVFTNKMFVNRVLLVYNCI